jgi:hypothetical protein
MTEVAWLVCDNPREMITRMCVWEWHTFAELTTSLGLRRRNLTERRYRLFACGCMRLAWHLLDVHGRRAVEVAEQYVEGERSFSSLLVVRRQIEASVTPGLAYRIARLLRIETEAINSPAAGIGVTQHLARLAAYKSASEAIDLLVAEHLDDLRRPAILLSNVFRDIFGNPFRPVTVSPAWRTDTAIALARQMYESRDFSAMPILADALQDAGCDSEDILNHCRDANATHVRGCWVVDLVLGKE